jgi:hypothetical protein
MIMGKFSKAKIAEKMEEEEKYKRWEHEEREREY